MKRDYLAWAALAAAIVVTASAEYALARACGFGPWVAAGVPAALDIYAVRALRARRDVLVVVLAMVGVNAASHLVTAGLIPVSVPLVVAVSAIAPLVMWRVHALSEVTTTATVTATAVAVGPPPAQVEGVGDSDCSHSHSDRSSRSSEVAPVPAALASPNLGEAKPVPVPAEPGAVPPGPPEPARLPVLGPLTPLPWAVQNRPGTAGGTNPEQVSSDVKGDIAAHPVPAGGTGGTSTGTDGGTGTADSGTEDADDGPPNVFDERVAMVRDWLRADPELTGTAVGERLGTTDGYGRRVRRAALNGHPT